MNKQKNNNKSNLIEERIQKACAVAYKEGYAFGYKNGKARVSHKEFKASVKSNKPAKIDKNKKWHGKKSKSWMWV